MNIRAITVAIVSVILAVLPLVAQQPPNEKREAPATATSAKTEAQAGVTAEQMLARLRNQWEALLIASIENAKAHGQTPLEYGTGIGMIYSPSWPKDLKVQRFGRSMRDTLLVLGWTAELTDDTPDRIVMRFHAADPARLEKRYGSGEATAAKMYEALSGIGGQIAKEHTVSRTSRVRTANGRLSASR